MTPLIKTKTTGTTDYFSERTVLLRSLEFSGYPSDFWNLQVTADLLAEEVIDLPVSWERGGLTGCPIYVDAVIASLPK